MPARFSSTVRYLFVSTLATALIYAGLETAAAQHERLGIRSCGWEGKPCELAPIVVKAPAAVVQVARG